MNYIYKFFIKVQLFIQLLKSQLIYRFMFADFGARSKIIKPLKLINVENVSIGKRVTINKNAWILTLKINNNMPKLVIEDSTVIGHFFHITCVGKIKIGKNVLIADKVYISDNYHEYKDIDIPIMNQEVKLKKNVDIGEGTWIGENVSIFGCKIGRNCIISANSVVDKDVPNYCLVGGVPARIIKKFNIDTNTWERVNKHK